MNPYLPPANGAPPFQAPPIPSGFNRQKGKKQFFHQKNHQGPRKQGQSCYNCGSPEHWAQNCTAPRRPLPVGTNHNRPPKRQKTATGPPGMPYGMPLGHQQQPQGPHHGYPHPPSMHPNYPPVPGPHGPPTPMSAQSPHFSQWQHHSPPPYYPHQGYPPYGGHPLPTPASAYGSQFPSPASPDAMSNQHHHFPPQYPYDAQAYPRKSHDYGRQRESYSPGPQQPWPPRRRSEEVPRISPPLEPWMEELQSLDIDDTRAHGGQIVWHPPQLVARPLPSRLTASDEVGNLPPLTSLPHGMSVSKYFLNKRAEEFECHIRNTSDWPFMMKDPVFVAISTECETVSMLELISRRNKLFESHKVKTPVQSAKTTPEVPDITQEEPMDQGLSGGSAESDYEESKRVSMTPTFKDHMEYQDANGEEYDESVKGYDEEESSPMEPKRESRNGSQMSHSPDPSHYRPSKDKRTRESYSGGHGQVSEKPQNKHHGTQNKTKRGDRRGGNTGHFRGQDRRMRGSRGSAVPRPSRQKNRRFKEESNESHVHGGTEHANGPGGSTNGHRDQAKQMNRKRQRDESPGDKGPRRQEDDSVPKNKMRQPVAAAYSRRW